MSDNIATSLDQKIEQIYSNIVTYVAGPLAVLFLVYAGYLYITSTGNPEQLGMAKDMIVSTIIAIVILLLAGLILQTIGYTQVEEPADLNDSEDQAQEEQTNGGGDGEETNNEESSSLGGEEEGGEPAELEDVQSENSGSLESTEDNIQRREME